MKPIPRGNVPAQSTQGPTRKTLLYVEDEDINWEITFLRLTDAYELHRARDAREACAFFSEPRPNLAAILMDIQLSGSDLDGIGLTRLFKGTLPSKDRPLYARVPPRVSAPIIFVTAYGARYGEKELLAAGGDSVVTKPVDFVMLNLTLSQLAAREAVRNRETNGR